MRTCYSGFGRGFLAELLQVVGIVSATALACNFHGVVSRWLSPWWRRDPALLEFMGFLVILLGTVLLVHLGLRKLANVVKWERLHWTIQGMGLALGGLRGLWWAGLVLLIMLSLGMPYLAQSIEERSVLGPQLVKVARLSVDWVADRYPGHTRRVGLIPAIKVRLPKLPETNL